MGGAKKQRKPGKGKEKTERKTAKAAEKRARRDDKNLDLEDDIDAILASIQKEEAKKTAVHVEENVAAPSPRCNCTVTINPMKDSELIIYGGEYYNGDKTYVYGDLYKYNADKGEWKLVCSPNSPPPRSAHQAVAWKNSIFMFGGEFTSPNQERFHHYKDLWRFDLNTNAWEQLVLKGSPGARSGHRMVLYKHKIILFGGFYDTLREVRYFNDLHVLDLDEYKWQEIKPKLGMPWPSPRSGFQFAVYLDEIFLYGGYFKDANAEKDGSSEKGVVHADMWVLDPRNWEWNKVKKSGMPPGPRAGFSLCTHKKRAILFGGVVDTEEQGDLLRSTFLNEIYAFQMDNHRWYPLELRKAKAPKQKRAKNELKKPNNSEHGTKATEIETSSLDNLVEQVEGAIIDDDDDENGEMAVNSVNVEKGCTRKDDSSLTVSLSVLQLKPCGRINACMVVSRDILYLYGGLMEVGDREVTLDDLYTLDLNKLDEWKCLIEASKSEWIDADNGEDDDEETDSETGEESGDDEDEDDDIAQNQDGKSVMVSAAEETAALIRGEGKKMLRKERKQKIESLRSTLGLADLQRTPKPGESLKDFFGRTNMYWQMAAYEHTQHTGKELRKDGFDLAELRYKELKPVLDELAKLEAEQKEEEEEKSQVMKVKKAKEKARSSNR